MTVKQKILASIEPPVKQSKHVKIDPEKLRLLAEKIKDQELPAWDNQLQFLGNIEQTIQYYFFLDSINFCFWAEKGKEKWQYPRNSGWISGYYAFSFAIKRFFENNPEFFDAGKMADISFRQFKEIFAGKGELQLLEKRHEIIRENFRILSGKYQGQAANLAKQALGDVSHLVESIVDDFPSFQDISQLGGNKIYFLKRAQIFASDIYYALKNAEPLNFKNLNDLTLFADYKIPQLLCAEGVLRYSQALTDKISAETLITAGSEEEIEIRAFTVLAGELLLAELEKLGRKLNSNQLDWILWVLAKNTRFTMPHHLTLTTYY
ncbi:MAG TPA: queuosine salvage family protein [Patescibacteria group bacterium]|jgi:hypothetical protein|nr:queuosine salvage family protein [Patescibacteria group bacterium]